MTNRIAEYLDEEDPAAEPTDLDLLRQRMLRDVERYLAEALAGRPDLRGEGGDDATVREVPQPC